ncbi:phage tail sheath family protein [Caldanaerobius polysaccharolyticus]|uniref:phage tail sheath family protein n=1 Tax=Caldanaerobius polysaccharolyticus TaxID=44256 RepID=UPI00047E3FDB|nr:hypothetical protein [Caldanaerobius polysaccharolyticus]
MAYLHGAYGELVPTKDTLPPSGVGTLPVYIGTAPVQQLADYSNAINKPIHITSFDDAKAKIGYDDDWDSFTLCEAVYAHFKNKIQPIGPIIVINVMDPAVHKTASTATITLTNGQGYLDEPAILSSISITGAVKGTDYSVEYTTDGRVLIKDLTGSLISPVTVSFDRMDKTKVQNSDIIGGIDSDGKRTGIACVDLIYQTYGMVPTILAAPGWSHIPEIKEELVARSNKINGHWDAQVNVDIDSISAKTIDAAKSWKSNNMYTDTNLKVCWPKVKSGDKTYWLSTMATVRMQQTDYYNDNVPYESPSNKPIDINGTILGDGTSIDFDELQANDLNSKGITTAVFRAGNWVLWGPHNGNYEYGKDIDVRDKFDCSVRMVRYLTNSFQKRYMIDVDTPLNRSKVDTILNDAQVWLNGLVGDGKLLYAQITFNETSNPTTSMVEGDFVFDVQTTTTPPGKSLTFSVQYTLKGLDSLFGGETA